MEFNKTTILLILVLTFSVSLSSQEITDKIPKHQIEFQHDNDFAMLTDRYYSSGLFLRYRRRLNKGIFTTGREQLTFELKQLAHTPEDIGSTDLGFIDRPYAGYSGFSAGWSMSLKGGIIETRLETGLTGPSSGAGSFQRWYHRAIVRYSEPTWFTEIEDSFHGNIYLTYTAEWELAPNPFSVHFAIRPEFAYGTKDIYAQPEFLLYLGRRNPTGSSIANHQINSTQKEIFFRIRMAYRFVGHNAFLEGNALGDNSLYTVEPNNKFVQWGFDVYHRFKQNDYKFGIIALTRESQAFNRHKYIVLAYARSF
ncbi:MAG: lipid A-modifier LpxR family protein [Bacteroidota bacterium]